jgi:TonB family protein
LRAADVFRTSAALAPTLALAPPTDVRPALDRRTLFPGTADAPANAPTSELGRARAATQGYVAETLAASTAREAPGVRSYLWNVRRRMTEAWRPGVVRVPNLGETLLAGFIPPERAMRILGDRFMRQQRRALEPTVRSAGAVDAIEAIGGIAGNGPSGRQNIPIDAGQESWRRNVRTTRAEVQVDQDAAGRILDVRVLHSSGMATFDRAAIEAVRSGLAEEDPIPLPGGRRSRWSFTVVATRRLITLSAGGTFDESRGWFSVQLPGQVSIRTRVQMESSAVLPAGG